MVTTIYFSSHKEIATYLQALKPQNAWNTIKPNWGAHMLLLTMISASDDETHTLES